MSPDLCQGSFLPGRTVLHRADPRTKLVLLLVFAVLVLWLERLPALLVLLLAVLLATWRSGRPLGSVLAGLRPVLWLAGPVLVFRLFASAGGAPLEEGARMVLRLLLLAGGTTLLTATTSPLALTDGLARLCRPLRLLGVPVGELALLLALALRFLPETFAEAQRLRRVQLCRAPALRGGAPLRRLSQALPLLVPLVAGMLRRGETLAQALEARCYRAGALRPPQRRPTWSRHDLLSVAGMLLLALALGLLERGLA